MAVKKAKKVKQNKLAVIIKESGLDKTKSQIMLDNFKDYFEVAAEWEKKASEIIVTSEDQKEDMKLARVGRLHLKEKRVLIEKKRKELKQQSIREGKAIEGIANVLKALIIPIEEHLDRQEHFIDIKRKEAEELERLEAEQLKEKKQIEADRIFKKAEEKKENIRKELEKIEKMAAAKLLKQKKEAEESARVLKDAADTKLLKQKEISDKKAKLEKEKSEKIQRATELRAKMEKERLGEIQKATELRAKMEKEKLQKKVNADKLEKERLEKELKSLIECPFCHKKFKNNK